MYNMFINSKKWYVSQVKIFSGSFGGATLWENAKYISPAKLRQAYNKKAANKYERRIEKKVMNEATRPETGYPDIEGSDFFKGDPLKKAEDVLLEGTVFVTLQEEVIFYSLVDISRGFADLEIKI